MGFTDERGNVTCHIKPGLQMRVGNQNIFFLFLNQNMLYLGTQKARLDDAVLLTTKTDI